MVSRLFFFFLSVGLFAQDLPVSESNAFIYNSFNYGKDFFNAVNPITMDADGSVWCQPYMGEILKINNADASVAADLNGRNYGTLEKVLCLNDCEYYCTSQCILVVRDKKIVRQINVASLKEITAQFVLVQDKIYFVKVNAIKGRALELLCFDGTTVNIVRRFPAETLSVFQYTHNGKHYLFENQITQSTSYAFENNMFRLAKKYLFNHKILRVIDFKDLDNFTFIDFQNKAFTLKKGAIKIEHPDIPFLIVSDTIASNVSGNQKYIYNFISDQFIPVANSGAGDTFFSKLYSDQSNSYYCGTNTNFLRLFPHIKKYPRLFYNGNSNSVFTLQQDGKGQIWAGSYQAALSIITNENKVVQVKDNRTRFLNGGTTYKDKMLLLGESNGGLILYDNPTKHRIIADSVSGYFTYISKDKKLYLGTSMKGIWHTDVSSLDSGKKINWHKINEKQGLDLENILTISEDRFGNLWYGSGRGIGVYDIQSRRCRTWKTDTDKKAFAGTRAILLDSYNTLWIGARNGELLFYNGKNATDYAMKNFISIKHPLFENGKAITFIHQWDDYLILGASDKILLFNLKQWHKNKTVSVRYLNPMEINLSSDTEQNTI
ncbi:MAG: hypothetical protein CFE23_14735, partial [Flavobacterium sp. BFFFF1]|uniref:two-component regulator propeller domain-containing protein n=1 Tax=Flavobacterium sp. BFFFF1 TaxID=2015557 RepID=UPI000BCD6F79